MWKLAVVALASCHLASALRMTPGGMKLKEHIPDKSLPMCKGTEDLQQKGRWVQLKQTLFDKNFVKPGKQPGCKEERKMWQPNNCNLPVSSKEVKERPKRFIFIGDSVQDVSAESFAWFLNKETPAKEKNCSYTGEHMKAKLLEAGFSKQTTDHTVEFIQRQLTKGHKWWGCNSQVSYIPMAHMPDMHAENMFPALMFAVKNFGDKPIGKEDAIVLNFGLHYTNDKHKKVSEQAKQIRSLQLMLEEWSKWNQKDDAPKLIWRQVSPQHWGGVDGTFSAFHEVHECPAIGGPKALDNLMQNKEVFRYRNDRMFEQAAAKANLKIDGNKIAVLPIWRASAERYDEHILPEYGFVEAADCTHYCTHGAVNRLWNSGLLALSQDMTVKDLPPTSFMEDMA